MAGIINIRADQYRVWFTSDLHLRHANILKYFKNSRPYKDLIDMEEKIGEHWNKTVDKKDSVFMLGDESIQKDTSEFFGSLNGNKYLILGNHSLRSSKNLTPYVLVTDYLEAYIHTEQGKDFVTMMHYPILEWNRKDRGSYHLNGHTHSDCCDEGKRICVCWDVWQRLVEWKEIKDLGESRGKVFGRR